MSRTLNLTANEEVRKNHLHVTFREIAGNNLMCIVSKLCCKNFYSGLSHHHTQVIKKLLASHQLRV